MVIVGLAAAVAAAIAMQLGPDAGADTLVDRGSDTFEQTERFTKDFGDEPVVVLVKEDLQKLLLATNGRDLAALQGLETCLSGQIMAQQTVRAPAVCGEIAALAPTQALFGPGTFISQAGDGAQQLGSTLDFAEAQKLLLQFGFPGSPKFINTIIFDSSKAPGTPKAKFSALFPSPDAALIAARLRPDLSDENRERALDLIAEAVNDPAFALKDGSYVVGGIPVVVSGLEGAIGTEIFILLAVAMVVMGAVLVAIFGPPQRLLPLAVALAAAAVTFGLVSAFGGALTLASIAVLPVLIGLGVDYAIQLQARFREVSGKVQGPARAAVETAAGGGVAIATAALATIAGFCVLIVSPIPVVRGFGVLLVLGVAAALGVALSGGLAVLSLDRPSRRAAEISVPSWVRNFGKAALALALRRPYAVLGIAAVLAVAGWAVGTQITITSDIKKLAPRSLPEVESILELEDETGISGELDIAVRGDQVATPEVLRWMGEFKSRVLDEFNFDPDVGCRGSGADLCPGIAVSDLFVGRVPDNQVEIDSLLQILPVQFLAAMIGAEPSGEQVANVSFLIPALPLDEQKDLIDRVREMIGVPGSQDGPPASVDVEVVGLAALAADANDQLAQSRWWLALAGLAAVGLVLIAVHRSFTKALIPLVPIVLATGWSALLVGLIGVSLNPMSVTLGALVIAISTEFSVILSSRFSEQRAVGGSVGEALRRTYLSTGAAVLASGLTAIAGFAVLISEALPLTAQIPMLRDFGIVTVLDLSASLFGVLVVLPAVLVIAEERGWAR